MGKKLTKEEVQQRLDSNFRQKVTLISDYINKRTKITVKCEECGYIWEILPENTIRTKITNKHCCPNCGVEKGKYVKCAYCGKEIYRQPNEIKKSTSGLFFCSVSCHASFKNKCRGIEDRESNNYRLKAFNHFKHECAVCGWNEDERILEVHHKDSNRKNNAIDNLCILCPICHKKITLKLFELTDDYHLIENTKYIQQLGCKNKEKAKVIWPSRDELKELIRHTAFTQIGKTFGVTDNAVRKWCDSYNLPRRKSDIEQYTDEEWDLI